MSVPAACIRRPVAVAMLVLSVILLGGISFVRLPIDLLPDISYPRLVVYTSYPNVAPSEIERLITERVEEVSAAIPGVERVSSVSRDGLSLVTLRFTWGTDMDFAMLGLREALDNVRSALPELASRPQILRVDPEAEPILVLSVAGGGDLWRTKELAEVVFKRRLEQLDGVAEAAVAGGLEREIQVELDPRLVEAYGLTLEEISLALAQANVSSPGGTILRGRYRYPLRTLGEIQTVPEIGDVVVGRQRQNGGTGGGGGALPAASGSNATPADGGSSAAGEGAFRLVRLRDVATVTDGFAEREATARYNGHESVGLLVFKEAGANTVAVARDVGVVLEQLRVEHPDVTVDVASSQATFISQAISNVLQALVIGGLLAFLVLFLFLRDARYPVAVALSIPISVIATFALLDASGVSMNIMSLGGLALGVGMLVDNSVVVLENIFRHRELGVRGALAAARGAEEVQGAVTAATLTTIAVFAPLIYVRGAAGELFTDLSLAVAFSLLVSIGAALTLLPVLAARWTGEGDAGETAVGPGPRSVGRRLGRVVATLFRPIFDGFDGWMKAFATWYGGVLVWALDHRLRVLTLSGVVLAAALALALTLERNMLPNVDQGMFTLRLELPEGTALDATTETAADFEQILLADGDVEAVFTRVGRDPRAATSGDEVAGLHTAVLDVRVKPDASTDDVVERARERGSRSPAATLSFETGRASALGAILGGGEADIAVRLRSEDLDAAFSYAQTLEAKLAALPMLGNVQLAQEGGQPQIQVEIDRDQAAAYRIEPREIADAIQGSMRGRLATEFVDFDRKIAVIVRLPNDQRYSLETLSELRVRGVPLRGLIHVQAGTGPAEIRREDQGRVVLVYADVISGGLDGAIRAIDNRLAASPPPRGVRAEVGGENEEMRRSFRDLAFAFGLAILLVYMILAAQFESLVQPLIILTAVPMAVVGAVGALALTGEGLNTMSLIGVVILVGIVDNDAVVKVDYINQVRARGVPLREAIIEAGHVRLRPILITTVTTVLGVIPMALGLGAGGELRAPLAIALIGGLTVATALTLIVVPVVYYLAESAREVLRGSPVRGVVAAGE
ncbi:MAG: efflux RND transporter permease subunit [Gemmatimonadetes bacterium]|nr:efflux RND transporter permease subunit [Gemmatimonadota bacterium]